MINIKKVLTVVIISILLITSYFTVKAAEQTTIPKSDGSGDLVYLGTTTKVVIPSEYIKPEAEFRAVWISALVGDVTSFSTEAQYKKEILSVFSTLEYYNMNVMIFHVRMYNDAFYQSKYNAWSKYYNTNPTWEALPWIIEEAHKRGIEFHAWLNPYRVSATVSQTLNEVASKFQANNPASNPNNLLKGTNAIILNPGIPTVRTFLVNTCMELVENYDIDAIHFDDYFYDAGVDDSFTRSVYNTENLSIDDFRRKQVNLFIESLSKGIRSYNTTNNKRIQLGISPSGIWKSGDGIVTYDSHGNAITNGSNTTSTFQHYGSYLYADTLRWINEEWIDYILPQTYWALEHSMCAYADLISWWDKVVAYKKVNLYSGMGLYIRDLSKDGSSWQTSNLEAYYQMMVNQSLDHVKGTSIFSYRTLKASIADNRSFYRMNEIWATPVIHPEIKTMTPISIAPVSELQVGITEGGYGLSFPKQTEAKFYVIYRSDTEITYTPEEIIDVIGNTSKEEIITYIDEQTSTGNYYYGVKAQSQSLTLSEGISALVDKDLSLPKAFLGDIQNVTISDNTFMNEIVRIQWNPLSYLYGNEIAYDFQYSYDEINWYPMDCEVDKEDKMFVELLIARETGQVFYQIQARNNVAESSVVKASFPIVSSLGQITNFTAIGDFITEAKVKFIWNNSKEEDVFYELQISMDNITWMTVSSVNAMVGVNSFVEYKLPISAKIYYFRIKATAGEQIGYSSVMMKNVYAYLGSFRDLKINGEPVIGPSHIYDQDYADITWNAISYGGKTVIYSASISYDLINYIPARTSNQANYLTNIDGIVTQRIYFNSTISKIYVLLEATVDNAYACNEIIEIYMQPEFLLADEVVKYLVNEQKAMIVKMGIFK